VLVEGAGRVTGGARQLVGVGREVADVVEHAGRGFDEASAGVVGAAAAGAGVIGAARAGVGGAARARRGSAWHRADASTLPVQGAAPALVAPLSI